MIERGEYGLVTTNGVTYTYGRHHLGLPELVTTGLTSKLSEWLLRSVDHIEEPGEFAGVLAIKASTRKLVFARYLADASIEALQILWPDSEGRWPWDHGYQGSSQPLLGGNDVHLEDPRG